MKRSLTILASAILILILQMPAKAQYVIKEADSQYELFDYIKAIDSYEQAYSKKQTLHAAERLASCYSLVQNYKESESWYAIAISMPGSNPEDMLNYAKALQNNAKYSEAKAAYLNYTALNKQVTPTQKSIWLSSCDSASLWMKAPRRVIIDNAKILNSPQSDWGATPYNNGVVFTSDRANTDSFRNKQGKRPFLKFDGGKVPDKKVYGWTGNGYLRLYEQKAGSTDADLFPLIVQTDYHVGPASFTGDSKEMFFTLTAIPKKIVYDKGRLATINVEIYSCKKGADGNWTVPVPFKYNKVNEYSVGDPYINKDGQVLYFVSNMPGGKGGTDIYYCKRNAAGEWGTPINLAAINTDGNERTPSFDNENNFYFSSDGRVGMGGLDIYRSKVVNGQFSSPVNVGYPVNSPQDDFAYNCDSLTIGYFASNRLGGMGSDDIYRFTIQKQLLFKLEGVAYDKDTKIPLTNAIISLTKKDGMPLKLQTDTDGKFKYDLEANSDYNLTGEKTGFRSDNASVTTINLTSSTTIKKDLYLERIVQHKEIVLNNIYYDFNKYNIRPDAAIELDKLVKLLKDNPTIWIELGSHTDSRGNDAYNLVLSQKRAESAVQYIISKGINKNRISAKGYGETQLLNGCVTGVKCTEAEHQVNRRTEFKIIKE